ncbi:hypothetical protein MMC10_004156 [Thelotrema lepadinum]|nr:hypothetical protein [Thelotrema lepadinum]
MGGTRRRTISDDDHISILSVPDIEKYEYRRSSTGSEISNYSRGSSRSQSRSRSASRDVSYGSADPMLPPRTPIRPRFKRSFYHYRIPNRTIRWLCIALMSTIILFILSLIRMGMVSSQTLEGLRRDKPPPPAPWESFEFLKRYYGGLRTLTPRSKNVREYPTDNITFIQKEDSGKREIPASSPFDAVSPVRTEYPDIVECFLDAEDKIGLPNIFSYPGVPEGFPEAVMGSYDVLGLSDASCFDRYGRLGPYGFGYSRNKGGTGAGVEGEREGADNIWAKDSPIDYSDINWHDAQRRCLAKNKHRFSVKEPIAAEPWRTMPAKREVEEPSSSTEALSSSGSLSKLPRTAIVIRTWWDYNYNPETRLYLRSLISELPLLTGGEYQVHFLIHVRDDNAPIWADPDTYDRALENALPPEFRGMGTLWSERQMNLIYGGLPDSNIRGLPVHGVYRSAHMPLQYFAQKHPEYDYFWNWEMDARYTGHWHTFFNAVRKWAREQPRKGLWERNERFYVPEVHGSWDDFKAMARVQSEMAAQQPTSKWANIGPNGEQPEPKLDKPVWGPLAPWDAEPFDSDPIPPTTYDKDKYEWGVGEEADFITFNPMFDPERTDWILAEDVTGYNLSRGLPPRRTAIVTASRLSRRLLDTMHNDTTFHQHTMFSEMWPASCALHHGLKAVYAPHPVYIDRMWPLKYLAKIMNNGKNGAVGGSRSSVFGDSVQHNLLGVSWHYRTGFAPNLWKRWLGYKSNGDGGEEEEIALEGRMCLPPLLLHPVKDMDLVIEGRREGE